MDMVTDMGGTGSESRVKFLACPSVCYSITLLAYIIELVYQGISLVIYT